jgi:trehalose 6-phosphate synthase
MVVVANRLPVGPQRNEDGTERWKRSPGGLVNALEPLLRAHRGAWVGWPGVADLDVPPFEYGEMQLHPVRLSASDVRDHYEGFSNATLWPLYHDVIVPPVFDHSWWACYVRVNRRFAATAAEISAAGATVWVQDYQLQLVPSMLREMRPDLHIGFFLHIPFPPAELFMQLLWRTEIVRGLLGSDLIGFHRPDGVQNFLSLARTLTDGHLGRGVTETADEPVTLKVGGRAVKVGAFPISIDATGLDRLARRPAVRRRAEQIRTELGNPSKIILGVDRLDYTKGIDVRLQALHEMLADRQITSDEVVMVQIATPSRERVEHYRRIRADVERAVGRINGEFGRIGHPVVHYLHTTVGHEELAAFYCAADVMLVTPLRDGMNLVCKEYVACRYDLGGALVLSEFAGAAAELTSAFLVNPHHLDDVRSALARALALTPAEGRRRCQRVARARPSPRCRPLGANFLTALDGSPAAGHLGVRSSGGMPQGAPWPAQPRRDGEEPVPDSGSLTPGQAMRRPLAHRFPMLQRLPK